MCEECGCFDKEEAEQKQAWEEEKEAKLQYQP